MPNFWRISQYVDLTGEGGRRRANRWNRAGAPIVYLGESVAGVVLERIVHLMDDRQLPEGLRLIDVAYPNTVECDELLETQLPDDWRANLEITQNAGDQWLQEGKTAIIRVPSAIIPNTRNVLLNPRHPDWHLVTVREHFRFDFEPRLKRLADFAFSYREDNRFVSPDE